MDISFLCIGFCFFFPKQSHPSLWGQRGLNTMVQLLGDREVMQRKGREGGSLLLIHPVDGICLHSRFIGFARKGWVWQRDTVKEKINRYPLHRRELLLPHISSSDIFESGVCVCVCVYSNPQSITKPLHTACLLKLFTGMQGLARKEQTSAAERTPGNIKLKKLWFASPLLEVYKQSSLMLMIV